MIEVKNQAHLNSIVSDGVRANYNFVIKYGFSSCGPCQQWKQSLRQVSQKYAGLPRRVTFYEVDVMNKAFDKALQSQFEGFPTTHVYCRGQLVETLTGYQQGTTEKELAEALRGC